MPHPQIKFGTDGWRGLIADDFTFANVRIAAQAVAAYFHGRHDTTLSPESSGSGSSLGRRGVEVNPQAVLPSPVRRHAMFCKDQRSRFLENTANLSNRIHVEKSDEYKVVYRTCGCASQIQSTGEHSLRRQRLYCT